MNTRPSRRYDPLTLAGRSIRAWLDHDAASMGAALSFYTLFSIAPVLLVATWIAGSMLDKESVRQHVLTQMQTLMGDAGAAAVGALLTGSAHIGGGSFATIVGVASLLIGATSVFGELQRDLDRVWETPRTPAISGIWQMVRTRILSFGLILGVGFLLLVSLVVSAALAAVSNWMQALMTEWKALLFVMDLALGMGIATVLFAMIYKILPHQSIAWGDVWTGALVTALLFTAGKALISMYLSKSAFTSGYGAAGSLLVLLLWIYYSAQIFLLGAEFTRMFAYTHGSRIGESTEGNAKKQSFKLEKTVMQKQIIAIVGVCVLTLLAGGCNQAKSPDKVASEVAGAEQKTASNVSNAERDASKDVANAAEKVDDKAKDLNNAEVKGAYDVAMARAEGDRKIALDKCEALSGDAQKACKDVAKADYEAAKANLKAMRTSEKQ
jgi:membrane protein